MLYWDICETIIKIHWDVLYFEDFYTRYNNFNRNRIRTTKVNSFYNSFKELKNAKDF